MVVQTKEQIVQQLKELYAKIPPFDCKCCGKCCGPIFWFLCEDWLIRDYMKEHNIQYLVWSREEYIKNKLLCPYFQNSSCIIYEVRPLICRLQGHHTKSLPCPNTKGTMSQQTLDKIWREYAVLKNASREVKE